MQSSESIKSIAPALVKALSMIRNVTKSETAQIPTKTGGKFSYSYATLPDVLEIGRAVLADNELAMMQFPRISETGTAVDLETRILHASGEWVGDTLTMPLPQHATPQEIGSVITYARRYHSTAMLGMGQEDDDGAKATEASRERPQDMRPLKSAQHHPTPTAAQEQKIADWCAAIEAAPNLDELKNIWDRAHVDVDPWDLPMVVNLIDAAKNKRGRDLLKKAA